jgi:hypothetical protein
LLFRDFFFLRGSVSKEVNVQLQFA